MRGKGGGPRGGGREEVTTRRPLTLRCHHQKDSASRRAAVCHFNVLISRFKITVLSHSRN